MASDLGMRSLKRPCFELTESAPAPTSSMRSSPLHARLLFDLWDNIANWMGNREKHHFNQTCRHSRHIIGRTGMLDVRSNRRWLNAVAEAIGRNATPELARLADKINRMIPSSEILLGPPPLRRTGLLHPFLTEDQRKYGVRCGLHDILTNRGPTPGIDDANFAFIHFHQTFLPELHGSINSWPIVKSLMECFGPWAFCLASAAIRSKPEYVLEAAALHGEVIVRYAAPALLNGAFVPELLKRVALRNPTTLRTQAIFTDCQARRYGRDLIRASGGSTADVGTIARFTKGIQTLPSLHDDQAVVLNASAQVVNLKECGSRTENRLPHAYPLMWTALEQDRGYNRVSKLAVDVVLAPFKRDPELLADLFSHRDVRSDFLDDVPAQYLNERFWKAILDQPFDEVFMWKLAAKLRDEATGEFTGGVSDDIISRFFLARRFKTTSDDPFDILYPHPHFPTVPVILKVYLSLPKSQQIEWLADLLERRMLPHSMPPEVLDRLFANLILNAEDYDSFEKLAMLLTMALDSGDESVRERLIRDAITDQGFQLLLEIVEKIGPRAPVTLPSPATP